MNQLASVRRSKLRSVTGVNPAGSFGHCPPGGNSVTVSADEPLWPSLVAVIVAVPTTSAVTKAFPLTVPTTTLLLVQVIARPVRMLPLASRSVAVNCCVPPTRRLMVAGVMVTEATAAGGGGGGGRGGGGGGGRGSGVRARGAAGGPAA